MKARIIQCHNNASKLLFTLWKISVKFTKFLSNFGTKTLGNISKPVCIFRKLGHTTETNCITFTALCFWSWSYQDELHKLQVKYEKMQNAVLLNYKI